MSNNGFVSRDDFWKFCDVEYREAELPHFGKVRIRSLSDGEQRELAAAALDEFGSPDPEKAKQIFARRAVAQVVDENGDQIFGHIDLERLASMRASITRPLYEFMVAFSAGTLKPDEDLKKS